MVRAAARGAVDFTRGDPRDFRWWLRMTMLCDAIEAEDSARLVENYNRRDLALLSGRELSAESHQSVQENIARQLSSLRKLLLPWMAEAQESLESWTERALKQWIAEWGDPDSPETQAKIAATVAALNRDNKALKKRAA